MPCLRANEAICIAVIESTPTEAREVAPRMSFSGSLENRERRPRMIDIVPSSTNSGSSCAGPSQMLGCNVGVCAAEKSAGMARSPGLFTICMMISSYFVTISSRPDISMATAEQEEWMTHESKCWCISTLMAYCNEISERLTSMAQCGLTCDFDSFSFGRDVKTHNGLSSASPWVLGWNKNSVSHNEVVFRARCIDRREAWCQGRASKLSLCTERTRSLFVCCLPILTRQGMVFCNPFRETGQHAKRVLTNTGPMIFSVPVIVLPETT